MKQTLHLISFISVLLVTGGCSKNNSLNTIDSGNSELRVTVTGINDPLASEAKDAIKLDIGNAQEFDKIEMVQHKAFDVQVATSDAISLDTDHQQTGNVKRASTNGTRAAVVPVSTTYRLYLFKKSDGTFMGSTSLTFGQTGQLQVKKGVAYNWYALSYNNTETVPDISASDTKITLAENRDVLYSSGEFTVPDLEDVQVNLPILFDHKFTRLAIEINTMGLFADMTSLSAKVKIGAASTSAVSNGILNIKTGELSAADNNQTLSTLSTWEFTDVDSGYQDRKIAYFYVPVLQENQALNATVQVNGLNIRLDDGTIRSFDTNLSQTPFSFQQNIPLIEEGKSYYCLFNILESPLTRNGLRWARQNLYMDSGTHNPYRFMHTYNPTISYMGWSAQQLNEQGDPCLKVYPEGTWRLPTSSEAKVSLIPDNSGSTISEIPPITDPINGMLYYQFSASGTASPYPGSDLRFNIVPIRPYQNYWSRYWTTPLPLLEEGNNLLTYLIDFLGWSINPFIGIGSYTQGGGFSSFQINYPQGLQIRCVRTQ